MNALKNRKGTIAILEQVFVVLFGVMLLVLIIIVFSSFGSKTSTFIIQSQYTHIANYVHSGIVLANKNMRLSDTGKIFLDLPDKAGGAPYRIVIIDSAFINVTDIYSVKNASIQIFNVNATVKGNLSTGGGGRTFLQYNRNANTITLMAEERVIS